MEFQEEIKGEYRYSRISIKYIRINYEDKSFTETIEAHDEKGRRLFEKYKIGEQEDIVLEADKKTIFGCIDSIAKKEFSRLPERVKKVLRKLRQ